MLWSAECSRAVPWFYDRPAFTTRTKQLLFGSCFTAHAQQLGLLEPYHLYILTVWTWLISSLILNIDTCGMRGKPFIGICWYITENEATVYRTFQTTCPNDLQRPAYRCTNGVGGNGGYASIIFLLLLLLEPTKVLQSYLFQSYFEENVLITWHIWIRFGRTNICT